MGPDFFCYYFKQPCSTNIGKRKEISGLVCEILYPCMCNQKERGFILFYFIFCFYLGMGDQRRGFGHSWGKVKCKRERELINFLCAVEKWLFIFGILNFGH
jgi:hypothetical protein